MEQKQKFPTEVVDLPSLGKLYPKDSLLSSGTIEMKYMTAKEEDILTNQNYIEKGIVVDKLLKALIVDKSIEYNQLLIGDKNALLVAARILGYGKDYIFEYAGVKEEVDLSLLNNKPFKKKKFIVFFKHNNKFIKEKYQTDENGAANINTKMRGLYLVSAVYLENMNFIERLKY